MSTITTHVLDTALGQPAAGMMIELDILQDGIWRRVAAGRTDGDGRLTGLTAGDAPPGHYRLCADLGGYFAAGGRQTLYGSAVIDFYVAESDRHLHLPLLVNPYGWSTYRGS